MDDPFIYGLLFILILFFQLLKSAFRFINPLQLEVDKQKESYHKRILNFISNRTKAFSLTLSLYYYICVIILIFLIKEDFSYIFDTLNYSLFITLLSILIGVVFLPALKILPSTLGEYFANRTINIFTIPLITLYVLTKPFILFISIISGNPTKMDQWRHTSNHKKDFNKEDLNKLVQEVQQHITNIKEVDSEIRLFQNALKFSEVRIRDCMIPRTEIVAVEIDDIETELKKKIISTGFSKILVYKNTIDNTLGYINSKNCFKSLSEPKSYIKNIPIFPESMQANKLLKFFIRMGISIALIVDEFGGTSGIVTIEDILEEIFGEIKDEHDSEDLFEKRLGKSDFIFSGRLEIDYLNEKYHFNIPKSIEYETLAGYILYHTEKIPKTNDQILIDNFKFNILKVSNTRLELVKLEILNESE